MICPSCMVLKCSGMGFNDLSGWPGDGITHIRIWDSGAAWCNIHKGVDDYDWSVLDAEVAQAQAIYPGVQFTYAIGGTPAWLATVRFIRSLVPKFLPPF